MPRLWTDVYPGSASHLFEARCCESHFKGRNSWKSIDFDNACTSFLCIHWGTTRSKTLSSHRHLLRLGDLGHRLCRRFRMSLAAETFRGQSQGEFSNIFDPWRVAGLMVGWLHFSIVDSTKAAGKWWHIGFPDRSRHNSCNCVTFTGLKAYTGVGTKYRCHGRFLAKVLVLFVNLFLIRSYV